VFVQECATRRPAGAPLVAPERPGWRSRAPDGCRSIYSLRPHSLRFTDSAAFAVKPHTLCCIDVTCRHCQDVMRFFACGEVLYVYNIAARNTTEVSKLEHIARANSTMSCMPAVLRQFIAKGRNAVPSKSGDEEDGFDTDFDFMFSSKHGESVIGAFKQYQSLPGGLVPRDCYASKSWTSPYQSRTGSQSFFTTDQYLNGLDCDNSGKR
jgi:hypothetical protein